MKLPDYLDELEKLADSATPGPWKTLPGDGFDHWQLYDLVSGEFIIQDDSGVEPPAWFLKYLELTNPQTIKAMIAVVREAEYVSNYCHHPSIDEALAKLEGLIEHNT